MITYFDQQPCAADLPTQLPDPFAAGPPHPLAHQAARALLGELAQGRPLPPTTFAGQRSGKMFGVLVVIDDNGRVGFLRGFSGCIAKQWLVPGFVPPLFDAQERDRIWPQAAAQLAQMSTQLHSLTNDQDAKADAKQVWLLKQQRTARSHEVFEQLLQGYKLANWQGRTQSLQTLFAPKAPPGGAGDCVGPKLIGYAHQERLRPIALAEFWWGYASADGNRRSGHYYPACTDKCGPILKHMLGDAVSSPLSAAGTASA